MISSYKHKGIEWVDIESPSVDEVKEVMQKFNISPIVADELLKPTARPRIDVYSNLIYLVLHFPVYDIEKKVSIPCEIDFVVGSKFIITAHYTSIIPLHELIRTFEVGILTGNSSASKGTGRLMFLVIKHLYSFALRQLEHIHNKITNIEEHIFSGQEKDMVKEISLVHRDVIEFQRSIHAHGSILKSMENVDKKLLGADFIYYLKSMEAELSLVENTLENSKETIGSLRETNDSLLSNRMNEIMQKLTAVALITFPVMFIIGIFSLNTSYIPLVGMKGDFWVVVFIIIASVSGAVILFKKKKLL